MYSITNSVVAINTVNSHLAAYKTYHKYNCISQRRKQTAHWADVSHTLTCVVCVFGHHPLFSLPLALFCVSPFRLPTAVSSSIDLLVSLYRAYKLVQSFMKLYWMWFASLMNQWRTSNIYWQNPCICRLWLLHENLLWPWKRFAYASRLDHPSPLLLFRHLQAKGGVCLKVFHVWHQCVDSLKLGVHWNSEDWRGSMLHIPR